MKKWITVLLVLSLALSLAGCGCEHEWAAATCVNSSTCTLCGETEGVALGHVWMAATCEAPKTCETCGATEGEPKGHALVEATCEDPKHCENCRFEEGEPLGHTWLEATTDDPKTCEVCALTEGERIITDFRFTTEATREIQGTWIFEVTLTGEMVGDPSLKEELPIELIINFKNDGTYDQGIQVTDKFVEVVTQLAVEDIYAQAAADGISKEELDAMVLEDTGMTLYEQFAQDMDKDYFNEAYSRLFAAVGFGGVYYVDNGMLYTGADWKVMMQVNSYSLEGDTLIIKDLYEAVGFNEDGYGRRLVTE